MTRLRTVAPLLVATVLAAVAVLTVENAGCADPGRYEPVTGGYVLVGSCLTPGDLVVTDPAPPAPARPATDADAPTRW